MSDKKKINLDALDETASAADLKAVIKAPKELKNIMIKNVPVELYDILIANGQTFAGYVKANLKGNMKRDGLL